ncbi:MAG: S8 family serine peptidase [Candidatus Wallbacteria bacterium]|nr:S8 family serine peptidase [Candidatus Wallbacteria bacterium]
MNSRLACFFLTLALACLASASARAAKPSPSPSQLAAHAFRFGLATPAPSGAFSSGDPLLPYQTYLATCRFLQARALQPTAAGVTVAAIDTGFDLSHPDLSDVTSPDGSAFSPAPLFDAQHGTQVLGVLGATTANGAGIAAAAPRARVIAYRAATRTAAALAIRDAVRSGARVLNLSWHCRPDAAVRAALAFAWSAGCVVVMASPNFERDLDARPVFPMSCAFPGMLVVVGSTLAPPWHRVAAGAHGRRSAHLAAPAEAVLTTDATGRYVFAGGTSIAAPIVSAAAALVLARDTLLDGAGVARVLIESARKAPDLERCCSSGGVLDVEAALRRVSRRRTMDAASDAAPSQPDRSRFKPAPCGD